MLNAVSEWTSTFVMFVASFYVGPKCGENMRLCERKDADDGFEWRCRKQGKKTACLRK